MNHQRGENRRFTLGRLLLWTFFSVIWVVGTSCFPDSTSSRNIYTTNTPNPSSQGALEPVLPPILTGVATADTLATISMPIPTPTSTITALVTYENTLFRISLQYPGHWKPNPAYGIYGGIPSRMDAIDGFFSVDAMGGRDDWTLEQATQLQVTHKLKPYGENPQVRTITVGGQEGKLIIPQEE